MHINTTTIEHGSVQMYILFYTINIMEKHFYTVVQFILDF